ncbi:MAG: translation initiation factor IF-2, partial [Candidatus Gracilibacteria bacterium]|nr:translation initiation factor IF-2 [Candidatus Gracilibacteria bacterium]
ARGAKTADIAILVVAADEGMKPQTIEALNHAKEAGVAIIVAINKIDRPSANVEKVKGELVNHELMPEDWGGDTICVPVSALKGEGIDALLDMVLLTSEMLELKANPKRLAVATVVESNLDESMGPIATVIVNTGTLQIGDDFIIGSVGGKVKSMVTDDGKKVKKAIPSDAVQISGLESGVSAGEILQVFPSKKIVRKKLEEIKTLEGEKKGAGMGVGEIMDQLKKGKMKFLKVVLKADTDGSLEALKQEIEKIKHEEVGIKIIHAGVGSVTETDVTMAAASQGIVVGFNIRISPRVKRIAEQEKVEIQNFDIIFELTDMLKKILEGLLEPEFEDIKTGHAVSKQIFWSKGKTLIVGCKVEKGYFEKGQKIVVIRDGENIGEGKAALIQHFEEKVNRIEENQECGIQFEGSVKIEEGDILEGWKQEQKIKTL